MVLPIMPLIVTLSLAREPGGLSLSREPEGPAAGAGPAPSSGGGGERAVEEG